MDFRHDELVRQNGDSLRLISEQTASDNKNMVAVAHEAAADSRTMKIATIIAMIYLPASLVAVSSPLPFLPCMDGQADVMRRGSTDIL